MGLWVSELVGAIATVMQHIFIVCTLVEDRLDRTKFLPPSFHTVSFGGKDYKTVDFDVSEGWVSFHHTLHWLLAELCKHVGLLTEEKLRAVGPERVKGGVFENGVGKIEKGISVVATADGLIWAD
jgi:E3 ubiquitin-protein ligase UBR1